MRFLIRPDAVAAAQQVADIIAARLRARPTLVLGLATGETMRPFYAALVARHRDGLSFADATSFNLDEYVGMDARDPASFAAYMRAAFLDHVDLPTTRAHLPRGDAPDPTAEAQRYEDAVGRAGGIDLQVLGIGRNGHLGFNEPGSPLDSPTRVTTLAPSTRAANAPGFAPHRTPRQAITMGLGTILAARECVLLATGAAKAAAVAQALEGPPGTHCPATVLQQHPAAIIVLDVAAAADLHQRDDCEAVHPGATLDD